MYLCYDRAVDGSFELRVAREASRDRNELVPAAKIINPVDPIAQLENVPITAGTW